MKTKAHYILLLFMILPIGLMAQSNDPTSFTNCVTDQLHKKLSNEEPYYKAKHQYVENKIYNSRNKNASTNRLTTSFTVPVVVHIVHQNGTENISDIQVENAIQHLNDAFENVGFYDQGTGINTNIDFCLAIQDPESNATTGITRSISPYTNVVAETEDDDLKAVIQWNSFDYLNIWVVKRVTSNSSGTGVAGYSTLPPAHGLPLDGIVIEANYFGTTQNNTKVLVHEAGHYLGLYHTFEDGCTNDDCQMDGDRVCDTPPDQSTAPVACDESINTCSTDEDDTSINNPFRSTTLGGLGDQNDLFINYMDYGYLPCYSAFTKGQSLRMEDALTYARQSLLTSISCQTPCPFASFEASFTPSTTNAFAGEEVFFTNTSDDANYYQWSVDDQIFSNDINTSYVFEDEGVFTVKLYLQDTINYCRSTIEQTINVVCEGEASFETVSTEMIDGETTIVFNNSSTAHINYEWYLDGTLYSTDTDLTITISDPGLYSLYLVGTTSACLNYSTTITLNIQGCTIQDKYEMHWYFGNNAALDFNGGEPVSVPGSEMKTFEGCSVISHPETGELLFYTNGLNIWNVNNDKMPNGEELLGGAQTSSLNNALVIPRPYHPDQYYVFTCDEQENSYSNGVNYSIVDMTLDGGLGDVTDVKNVYLGPLIHQGLNATYHKDGEKVWIVHKTEHNVLSIHLIDETGVGPEILYSDPDNETWFTEGRFFNSGKRMLFTRYTNGFLHFVIFNFNNETGAFSNPKEFMTTNYQFASVFAFELSPDDSKLYAFRRENDTEYGLYQWDLSLTTTNQIAASKTKIRQMALLRKLLLAPNGKIYHTNNDNPFLGVINFPNEAGSNCEHIYNSVNLSPGESTWGFPKFVRGREYDIGVDDPEIDLGPNQFICSGLTTVLNPDGSDEYNYLWQDGSTDPSYTVWQPGTYWVTVSNECGSRTDYIEIIANEIDIVDLGSDIVSTEQTVTLNAGTVADFYLWSDGSTNSTLEVTESGTYSVTVSTDEGCYQIDDIYVYFALDFRPDELFLYPNPSTGRFILEEVNVNARYNIDYTIYDAIGRKIIERSTLLDHKIYIDLTDYAAGVYFLHWETYELSGVFRMVVAK